MAPLAQLIHETVFDESMRRDYIDIASSFPILDALRAVTRDIRPVGIMAYGDGALSHVVGAGEFRALVLRYGYVNSVVPMQFNIPVARTINSTSVMNSVSGSPHADQTALYVVVAPNNELLCGPGVGVPGTEVKLKDPAELMTGRVLRDDLPVVYDQQYTMAFMFAHPTDTVEGGHRRIRERCVRYSECRNVLPNSYRAIATMRLGIVPLRDGQLTRLQHGDGRESYEITDILYNPDSNWTYSDMSYERLPNAYASLTEHATVDAIKIFRDEPVNVDVNVNVAAARQVGGGGNGIVPEGTVNANIRIDSLHRIQSMEQEENTYMNDNMGPPSYATIDKSTNVVNCAIDSLDVIVPVSSLLSIDSVGKDTGTIGYETDVEPTSPMHIYSTLEPPSAFELAAPSPPRPPTNGTKSMLKAQSSKAAAKSRRTTNGAGAKIQKATTSPLSDSE